VLVLGLALVASIVPQPASASPGDDLGPRPGPPPNEAPSAHTATGAIVVATSEACRAPAKALARSAYADEALRPSIDEPTARALVGELPSASATADPTTDPKLEEIREVVQGIGAACSPSCDDSGVGRRLAASLGQELGVALVVVVSCPTREAAIAAPASARVLRVEDGRFAQVVLSPRAREGQPGDWSEASAVLRALLVALPATPPPRRTTPARPAAARPPAKPAASPAATTRPGPVAADADEEDDGFDFISSPWFWGGLGAVVAVGVTVIALSQTSLNDPGVVQLQGRVSP